MTHEEINRQIAEKVFGLVPCQAPAHKDGSAPWPCYAKRESPLAGGELSDYAGDLNQAMRAAQEVGLLGTYTLLGFSEEGKFQVIEFEDQFNGEEVLGESENAAEAICLAILKSINPHRSLEPERGAPMAHTSCGKPVKRCTQCAEFVCFDCYPEHAVACPDEQ